MRAIFASDLVLDDVIVADGVGARVTGLRQEGAKLVVTTTRGEHALRGMDEVDTVTRMSQDKLDAVLEVIYAQPVSAHFHEALELVVSGRYDVDVADGAGDAVIKALTTGNDQLIEDPRAAEARARREDEAALAAIEDVMSAAELLATVETFERDRPGSQAEYKAALDKHLGRVLHERRDSLREQLAGDAP